MIGFKKAIQRFLAPQFVVSIRYYLKFRAMVSVRAEVEMSESIHLGKGVVIGSFSKVKATDAPLVIGADSGVATSCFISATGKGITIGEHCIIGPNVNIASSNYRYEISDVPYKHQGSTSKGIEIGDNVWVGSGVTILDGSKIGDNSIVVANSPANSLIQGNPAKVILKRVKDGTNDA